MDVLLTLIGDGPAYIRTINYNEIKKIIEDTDMINVVRAKAKGIDFYSKPYRALLH